MAGILNGGLPRLISAKTHAVLDYVHAGSFFLMGRAFSNSRNRRVRNRASKAAYAVGAGVLANALMTDYPGGVFRSIPSGCTVSWTTASPAFAWRYPDCSGLRIRLQARRSADRALEKAESPASQITQTPAVNGASSREA